MLFGREPVAWMAALRAVIALVAAFGFELSGEQVAAIIVFAEAVLALITRSQVTPNRTVDERLDNQRAALTRLGALCVIVSMSIACALVPKPNPTPDDEQARLRALDSAVSHAASAISIARAGQRLTIALGDTMPPRVALQIAEAQRAFFLAADKALAVAQDTSQPHATRLGLVQTIVREGRALIEALRAGPASTEDDRIALQQQIERAAALTGGVSQ